MGFEALIKAHLCGEFEAARAAGDIDALNQMMTDLTSFLGYAIACATTGVADKAWGLCCSVEDQLEDEVAVWAQEVRAMNGTDQSNIIRPSAFGQSAAMPVFSMEATDGRTV